MLSENPNFNVAVTHHTLLIGLCSKVEAHTLTTERANNIFENFRCGLIYGVDRIRGREARKRIKVR